jgi:hypothetical protein
MRVKSREAVRGWLNATEWDVAATLTFSKETHDITAKRLMRLYVGRMNRLIFKNAVKNNRGKKRVELVIVEENNSIGTNLHFHLAIKMPKELGNDYELFTQFLAQLWKEHCGKNFMTRIKAIYDSKGWIDYITKGIKSDNCDTINLFSSHIVAANLLTD